VLSLPIGGTTCVIDELVDNFESETGRVDALVAYSPRGGDPPVDAIRRRGSSFVAAVELSNAVVMHMHMMAASVVQKWTRLPSHQELQMH